MGGPLIEIDGIGIGRAAREGGTLGEVLKTKRSHASGVALRIVGLIGVGARLALLQLRRKDDVGIAVGVLQGDVGTFASEKGCEGKEKCDVCLLLHVWSE